MAVTTAVIPAAGFGTRFLPATRAMPKELLTLVDRPIIQYAVEEAAAAGITDVAIVIARGKEAVVEHFARSASLEAALDAKGDAEGLERLRSLSDLARVTAVYQDEALGLGHAVACARDVVGDAPFAVLLPDEIFLPAGGLLRELVAVHEERDAPVIAVQRVPLADIVRYGSVGGPEVAEGLVRMNRFVEKPEPSVAPSDLASIGRYVLTPDVFDAVDDTAPGAGGEVQLTDAIAAVAVKRPAFALTNTYRRWDVGNPLGHLEAVVDLGAEHPVLGRAFRAFLQGRAGT